jgi:hypothetical protein
MTIYVVSATYIGNFKFRIFFDDGSNGIADLSKLEMIDKRYKTIDTLQIFKNETFVKTLQADGMSLSKGNIDISPQFIYELTQIN